MSFFANATQTKTVSADDFLSTPAARRSFNRDFDRDATDKEPLVPHVRFIPQTKEDQIMYYNIPGQRTKEDVTAILESIGVIPYDQQRSVQTFCFCPRGARGSRFRNTELGSVWAENNLK